MEDISKKIIFSKDEYIRKDIKWIGAEDDSFEELNYLSNFNSIFPNSHLFDLRVISPESFYLDTKSIF